MLRYISPTQFKSSVKKEKTKRTSTWMKSLTRTWKAKKAKTKMTTTTVRNSHGSKRKTMNNKNSTASNSWTRTRCTVKASKKTMTI